MTSNSYKVYQYLDGFINYEDKLHSVIYGDLKLYRIKALLDVLGRPQDQLKIVHIAGTKGKGSTSAMTAQILKEAGYKTGLYTSPHVYNFKERIRILEKVRAGKIDGELFNDVISDDDLSVCIEELKPAVAKVEGALKLGRVTFYELFTALALYYFNEKKTEVVVLETGLGGRLDATNVVSSLVAAITPISLEHTRLLGDTVEKIAYEKSCIIKNDTAHAVLALQNKEALQVLVKKCKEIKLTPVIAGRDIICRLKSTNEFVQFFDCQSGALNLDDVELPLLGEHQLLNASVSVGIIHALKREGFVIDDESVVRGFKNVFWPCRFERISMAPNVILDAAHNEDSVINLINAYKAIYPHVKPLVIVGVSEDKDKGPILKHLNNMAGDVILTKANHKRGYAFSKNDCKLYFNREDIAIASSVKEAFDWINSKYKGYSHVLVTGSVFVVSEMRKLWFN